VEVFGEVIRAGAVVCNAPDTTGYGVPHQIREMFRTLREKTPGGDRVVWSTHCHNDLGLAVANSLAAVEGGARQVECTINGIGERAGNTSMEEVVMGLKTRHDYFKVGTRVATEQIYPASRLLSHVIGVPVAPTKPVVGDNAFAHEAGIHQDGVLKNVLTYEIMRPADVGRPSNSIVLGKHSGRHAFASRLRDLGIDLEKIDVNDAFARFKDLADKKKEVYDDDLYALAREDSGGPEYYELREIAVRSSLHETPVASVTMLVGGAQRTIEAKGDGVVDACYRAINDLAGVEAKLQRYQVKAITGGTDAVGDVSCLVRVGDVEVRGHGTHTDVLMASAYAFVDALNRYADCVRLRAAPSQEQRVVGP